MLVVEDNLVNQRLAEECLPAALGTSCRIAEKWPGSCPQDASGSYDLILMDIHMLIMDGISPDTARSGRCPGKKRPYIAALTAFAHPGDREDVVSRPGYGRLPDETLQGRGSGRSIHESLRPAKSLFRAGFDIRLPRE